MSVRWQLFASYLGVILVAVVVLGITVDRVVERRATAALEESLATEAALVGEIVSPQAPGELQATARRLGEGARVRITLIAADGRVLADSEHDPATMDNHATRPEVREARRAGRGHSVRRSATLGTDMLYVALRGAGPVGVVRVAVPMDQVAVVRRHTRNAIAAAAAVAALVALLLSFRLSRRLVRVLRDLSGAARRVAEGDLEARVRPRGHGELGQLAESFNEMATRLRGIVRELREEKQRAETILARLGEAIIVTDGRGQITLCNQAAERAFGLSCEEVRGLGTVEATRNHALDAAFRRALATGETAAAEVEVLFPQPRTFDATVTPIGGEEPMGAVAVLHDVTALRRLETVRQEFVANASHELQTPITAIKAMAEALLSGRDDPELADRFLPEMERQADRLGALVRDLLDLAAIESGPVPRQPAPIDAGAAAAAVAGELAPLAAQRALTIQQQVPEGLMVMGDWSALSRVLANLLDNAIKYTDAGGQVGLQAALGDGLVNITVWDTGIGIPSTDLPRIFERFYRVDKARSRRLGGTGLGLSIVKHLAEAMHGRVTVESELGRGSRFTVSLPAARAATPTPTP
jgi:two-component system phosphate regulon sensor histidine kinase PhoR